MVIINVYFPCVGTNDRLSICDELVNSLLPWLDKYSSRNIVIGGDFNTDLDVTNPISDLINQFTADCDFSRCDRLFDAGSKLSTYCNEALNHYSTIDFFLTSDASIIKAFDVMDLDCNFSDHRPINIICHCAVSRDIVYIGDSNDVDKQDGMSVSQCAGTALIWSRTMPLLGHCYSLSGLI